MTLDEIGTALKRCAPPASFVGPGASETDISAAEAKLGVTLPGVMRCSLRRINGVSIGDLIVYGVRDQFNRDLDWVHEPLIDGFEALGWCDRDHVRGEGLLVGLGNEYPATFVLPIASDLSGDRFAVWFVEDGVEPVVWIDHETLEGAIVASSYLSFLSFLCKPGYEENDVWPFGNHEEMTVLDPGLKAWCKFLGR